MYNPIVGLVKLSVLVFILRFSGVKTTLRYIVWATSIFTALQMVAVLLVMVFNCVPFAKNWDVQLKGRCVDSATFTMASSCFQIVTDGVAVGLPFYIFSMLKMSRKRRVVLGFVFSLGIMYVFSWSPWERLELMSLHVTQSDHLQLRSALPPQRDGKVDRPRRQIQPRPDVFSHRGQPGHLGRLSAGFVALDPAVETTGRSFRHDTALLRWIWRRTLHEPPQGLWVGSHGRWQPRGDERH